MIPTNIEHGATAQEECGVWTNAVLSSVSLPFDSIILPMAGKNLHHHFNTSKDTLSDFSILAYCCQARTPTLSIQKLSYTHQSQGSSPLITKGLDVLTILHNRLENGQKHPFPPSNPLPQVISSQAEPTPA